MSWFNLFLRRHDMGKPFCLTRIRLALIGISWVKSKNYEEYIDLNNTLGNFFTNEPELRATSIQPPNVPVIIEMGNIPIIQVNDPSTQTEFQVSRDRADFITSISNQSNLSFFVEKATALVRRYKNPRRIGIIATYVYDTDKISEWFDNFIFKLSSSDLSETLIRYNRKSTFKKLFDSNKIVQIQELSHVSSSEEHKNLKRISIQLDINTPAEYELTEKQALDFFNTKIKLLTLTAGGNSLL